MRTELHRVRSDCYKLLLSAEGKKEETLELVVPDRCGDIAKILDVRGQLYLSSKRLKDAEAQICSYAELCVLFVSEGGSIEYVPAQLTIEQSFALGEAPEACELIGNVKLTNLEARALNPRKLLLRAECSASVACCAPASFSLCDAMPEEAPCACIQSRELKHSLITDLREKSFTISDEYTLPSKYAGAKMLSAETRLSVYDTKPVGTKLVFKANADISALFLDPEDGRVFKHEFTSQFSQIIEIDAAEDAQCLVLAALKETEFIALPERETPCFSMRLSMLAQALCIKQVSSAYIADAYSTSRELSLECERVAYSLAGPVQRLRIPLKGALPQIGENSGITYLAPNAVLYRAEGGKVLCSVSLGGVAESEEGSSPLKLTLSAEESVRLEPEEKLQLLSGVCEQPSIEPGGTVNLAVCCDYCVLKSGEVTAAGAMDFSEETCSQERPALTVLLGSGESDAWTLAKKYRSTVELIAAANSSGDDFDIGVRPLFIPRA